MDIDGVDAEILYFGGPLNSVDPALRLNSVRGYNRWLSDFASHAPDRLLGVASIPTDSPEMAVEEIRWAAQEPALVSGAITLFPNEGEYGDDRWNPMWEAFLESGFPVALHSGQRRPGTPALGSVGRSGPVLVRDDHQQVGIDGVGFGVDPWSGDAAISRPEVRNSRGSDRLDLFLQVLLGSLVGEAPFLDREQARRAAQPLLRRQMYATFMEDPVGLRERHHIGIDNIMWASDYPHSETTWPNSKSLTDEWFTQYGEEDKAKILWQNAAKLYNLI